MKNLLKLTTLILCLSILFTSGVAIGQEKKVDYSKLLGKWEFIREGRMGTMTTVITFFEKDGKLQGTWATRNERELKNIKFDGENLSFEIELGFDRRGRDTRSFSLNINAKLKGDKLEGTFNTPRGEREFSATRVIEEKKEK